MASAGSAPKNLLGASVHLLYEIDMLLGTQKLLASDPTNLVIKNALLESFGIHLRSLDDFFYKDAILKDVTAKDYVRNWKDKRPMKSPTFDDAANRVDKEIAHLTYHRLDVKGVKKDWHFTDLTKELMDICECFLKFVNERHVVKELLKHKEPHLFAAAPTSSCAGATAPLGSP